ncbi:MAG TPA: FkbM family methyltransferase [Hyphomicrobium sp.]|jgi:FkbM family methyltransferase
MIDVRALLAAHLVVPERVANVANSFLSTAEACKRYALGRNAESATLDLLFGIEAFVDDFAPSGSIFRGKPVIPLGDVPEGAIVVNCSTSIGPVSAFRRLAASGLVRPLNYSDLTRVCPQKVPLPGFVRESREDLELNAQKYTQIESRFSDRDSKIFLNDLISFRLTGDPETMKDYKIRLEEQYFEPFLSLEHSVFVDAGGFDGDTTQAFCDRCNSYQKVILFEPSPLNLARARVRLAPYRDIEFFEFALSDRREALSFDAGSGSASSVSASSQSQVAATTLDDEVRHPVTVIKMDLEGWELKALQGARRHIMEDHPALAIAAYHRASDIWRIPELIFAIRDDYDLYLRHYTEGWSETVLFFIPRS